MNKTIAGFARQQIKDGLNRLPVRSQNIFKCLYSPDNPDCDIYTLIGEMPDKLLDRVLSQVENTLNILEN